MFQKVKTVKRQSFYNKNYSFKKINIQIVLFSNKETIFLQLKAFD